jgi:bacillithiol synthase
MKKHCIELEQTGQFSKFFLDYIKGDPKLKPFYSHNPELGSFEKAIEQKNFPIQNRAILVNSLKTQYEGLEKQTFTVTTGHQLNLFTGPLYFIYKIVSTINLAKKLNNAYPDQHIVPVYWMASEDHDFEEINYFKLDGKKYQWESNQTGAVGDYELDNSFKEFLKTVPFAADVFKTAYLTSKTLAEAVRKYVNELFGDEGLVIVDGASAELKQIFTPVIHSDLFKHEPYKYASSATDKLEELGYKSQIYPREINFFYLDKGIRERIERTSTGFGVINTSIQLSEEEIKGLIETHPERFSPNVVLRPLYQEMILPNLAYLGGPAEVVYWLQLKEVFEYFQVQFPILLPRNFALLMNSTALRKMEKMNWTVEDLFQDFTAWKKDFILRESNYDILMEKEREVISALFDQKGQEATLMEKSLSESFAAGKVRVLKIVDQMGAKLRKAEERRQQINLDRAKSLEEYIKPGGSPQERVVNMMQFYLADPDLIQKLLECFDPLDFRMMILEHES